MREIDKLAREARFIIFFWAIAHIAWMLSPSIGRDDTDPKGGRSGLRLLTDAATGCQYLSHDGITPRLDANGQHMGWRPADARGRDG